MGTVRVTLELDLERRAISGSLMGGRGEPRRFDGWLQLASALEVARADARDRGGEAPDAGTQPEAP